MEHKKETNNGMIQVMGIQFQKKTGSLKKNMERRLEIYPRNGILDKKEEFISCIWDMWHILNRTKTAKICKMNLSSKSSTLTQGMNSKFSI